MDHPNIIQERWTETEEERDAFPLYFVDTALYI